MCLLAVSQKKKQKEARMHSKALFCTRGHENESMHHLIAFISDGSNRSHHLYVLSNERICSSKTNVFIMSSPSTMTGGSDSVPRAHVLS